MFPRRRRNRNADGENGEEYGRGEYRCHVVSNAHTRWRNNAVSAGPRPVQDPKEVLTTLCALLASADSAKPSPYAAAGEGNDLGQEQNRFSPDNILNVVGHDKPRFFNTSTLIWPDST